ncbi:hypothetical protein Acsp06_37110 [Actinomycetospora sp. NBRC 106375]|uniref:hypothetical protein n=1 Tax=Actinomycetospora sp. NBRC 106375 TaxID=3032207 RepID=UPI0024A4EA31|nr:hypothetical protein [Actinomycetospora sp. NBRC 106375]GLZ47526.1 hypothetical protein Acsp06_37110 [Actinomycetospora sp. NBRC 106375]
MTAAAASVQEVGGPAAASAGVAGTAAPPSAGERLQRLAVVLIDRLAAVAADKVEDFAGRLEELKANGGVGLNALLAGGLAKLQGQNPVWAAIKGAVGAMSTTTKVLVALLLILVAVLSPVALLVLALVLLVAAIVGAVTG